MERKIAEIARNIDGGGDGDFKEEVKKKIEKNIIHNIEKKYKVGIVDMIKRNQDNMAIQNDDILKEQQKQHPYN